MTGEIKLWKDKKIECAKFEFSCGGDSMGDTEITFYDKNKKIVLCPELENFFDDDVYNNVEFWVNSDGHYIGEHGVVDIRLNDDEDDFEYEKYSTSEWSETKNDIFNIELNDEQVDFINKYVANIIGGEDDIIINYKKDFILDDKLMDVEASIINLVGNKCDCFIRDSDSDGSWYTMTTTNKNELIHIFKNNKIKIYISYQVIEYKD